MIMHSQLRSIAWVFTPFWRFGVLTINELVSRLDLRAYSYYYYYYYFHHNVKPFWRLEVAAGRGVRVAANRNHHHYP